MPEFSIFALLLLVGTKILISIFLKSIVSILSKYWDQLSFPTHNITWWTISPFTYPFKDYLTDLLLFCERIQTLFENKKDFYSVSRKFFVLKSISSSLSFTHKPFICILFADSIWIFCKNRGGPPTFSLWNVT